MSLMVRIMSPPFKEGMLFFVLAVSLLELVQASSPNPFAGFQLKFTRVNSTELVCVYHNRESKVKTLWPLYGKSWKGSSQKLHFAF